MRRRIVVLGYVRLFKLRVLLWRLALRIVRASRTPCQRMTPGLHRHCIFWKGHRRRCQTGNGTAF